MRAAADPECLFQPAEDAALSGDIGLAVARARALVDGCDPATAEGIAAGIAGLRLLARLHFQAGTPDLGLLAVQDGLLLCRGSESRAQEAIIRAMKAWLQLELGRGLDALYDAFEALRLAGESGDPFSLSWCQNVVAVAYWSCHQFDRATNYIDQAIAIARERAEPRWLGWWLINLGGLYHTRALLETSPAERQLHAGQALSHTQEALDHLTVCGDVWAQALCLVNLAECHLALGDAGSARICLDRESRLSLNGCQRSTQHRLLVHGLVLIAEDRSEAAIAVLRQGLAVAEDISSHEGMVFTLAALSRAYENLDQYRDALHCLRRARDLEQSLTTQHVQQRSRMSETAFSLQRLETQVREAEQARTEAARSVAILREEAQFLAEQVLRDPLTGIGNRRRLDRVLIELDRSAMYAIAMVDVDHFKSINDRHGHLVGDIVLQTLAGVMVREIDPDDVVVRFGGEEFTLVFRHAGIEHASAVCQRMRRAIDCIAWDTTLADFSVSASFGVAAAFEAGAPMLVLALADQRLQDAKRMGRNRVVFDRV